MQLVLTSAPAALTHSFYSALRTFRVKLLVGHLGRRLSVCQKERKRSPCTSLGPSSRTRTKAKMSGHGLSSSDFNALASMPHNKPLLSEVTSMLQRIVDTFQESWICDFPFTDAPVHIRPLTSLRFIQLSLPGKLQVTRFGAHSLEPSHQTTPHPIDEPVQKMMGNYLLSHMVTRGDSLRVVSKL